MLEKEEIDCNFTIKGRTFKKSECKKLGGGTQKIAYQFGNYDECFLRPYSDQPDDHWNLTISSEKNLLDQIISLGLKAQNFEHVDLKIEKPGGKPYTLPVLLTKDFQSLCKNESMVIYNVKGSGEGRVIGKPIERDGLIEGLKKEVYAQGLLSEIIKEYAVCLTFKLPISVVNIRRDDSEHYCFKLPQSPEQPPIAHYMFWDVVGDFGGLSLPYIIPTLAELKSGYGKNKFEGIRTLANQLACALEEVSGPEMDTNVFLDGLESPLLEALKNENLLNSALEHARNVAINKLNEELNKVEDPGQKRDRNEVIDLIFSAISTNDLDLLKRVCDKYLDLNHLQDNQVRQIMAFSKKYNNEPINDYLRDNLQIPFNKMSLKNEFLESYRQKLQSDKEAWHGWYSFFVKSHVNEKDSLLTLVEHAKGNSQKGTGGRSREVMKQLGWLDNSNKVINDDLKQVLDSYGTEFGA